MLRVNNLSVSYEKNSNEIKALEALDLSVEKGDIYALIGPSGCGKSTLLNVLSGVCNTYSGEVLLEGECLDPKKCNIGYIPQHFGLLPWKNVKDNCMLPFKIKKIPVDSDIKKRFDEITRVLDIHMLMDRFPNELSGGQKQRAAIARTFIMEPDILLMDEPFSSLDSMKREEAQELFLEIWNKYEVTTIFVTHSISEAIIMGKKIAIMSNQPGKIIKIINNDLFNNPEMRDSKEFAQLSSEIRSILKRGCV